MMTRLERRLAQQRQQRRLRQKRFLTIAAVLLAVAIVASAAYWWLGSGFKTKRASGLPFAEHKINILVLGVDERADDAGRSDTMFVVTVDTNTREVSVLSVPRDTRVKIPGFGWDKINHAYAEGGVKLSRQTVEDLLGLPIDYHVAVNFAGFYKIVDAIGGVTIQVDKRMYYEDPYDNLVIDFKPGVQRMDGKTAIKYVRYRGEDGDLGRIERQQKFLKAMLQEVTTPAVITRIPAIIKEVNAVLKTDMSQGEMLNLAKVLTDAYKQGLKTDTVPGRPGYIADISYWLPDIVALRSLIFQNQNIAMDDKQLAAAEKLGGEYERSIPHEMKIAEIPKSLQPVKTPAPADKTKPATDKPSAAPAGKQVSDKLRVTIINASGTADAGDKIAAIMKNQGFEIAGISTASAINRNTVVIAYTTNNAVVSKLTGLPFKYVLQVTKDDSKANQVSIVIGKDYASR
ncbi:MAG: LCP family protein [Negativicutes bacterium]|nr:LCP family protein [Negativicutes bacterium]